MIDHPEIEAALTGEWDALLRAASTAAARLGPRPRESRPARAELFAELQEVRERFASVAVEAVTHAGERATSAWSLRELLAHLASWASEFRREVEIVLQGGRFEEEIVFEGPSGPASWNEAEVRARDAASLEQIAAEFDRATAWLQDLALTGPDDRLHEPAELPIVRVRPARWRVSIAQVMLAKCAHDHYHLSRIEALLRGS